MTYRLADYQILERLAVSKTTAHRLDDRACRYIYTLATEADLAEMDTKERAFFDWLSTNQAYYIRYDPTDEANETVRPKGDVG